ncbi:MAG: ATP-binding cassette domain-containing protein [Pseudomonadota bacterium]
MSTPAEEGLKQAAAPPPNGAAAFSAAPQDGGDVLAATLAILRQNARIDIKPENPWLISLCLILKAVEPGVTREELLEALPFNATALDEPAVLSTLANFGYTARTHKGTLRETDTRLLPALFVADDGAPVVLVATEGAGYRVLSSLDNGPERRLDEDAPGRFLLVQRYDESRAPTSRFLRRATGHTWSVALLGRFKAIFGQSLVAGCVLNLLAVGTPVLIMLDSARVVRALTPAPLAMLAVGLAITVGFECWMRNIRASGLNWFSARLDNVVGNKIFTHLLDLAPELTARASVSSQIARIKTFEALRDFLASAPFLAIMDLPFVAIALIAMAVIAGPLALVPVAFIGFYFALFFVIRSRMRPAVHIAAKAGSARQQFTIDALEKIADIRAHGISDRWEKTFRMLSGREITAQMELRWLATVTENVAHALTFAAAIATIGVGVQLVWSERISGGAMVASILLVWRVLTPFYWLCTIAPRLEQLRNSKNQIDELMELESETESTVGASRLPKIFGAVSFDNVSLEQEGSSGYVFRDLSFSAAPGELVALIGASGTGKGAVLKLVQALAKPTRGVVRIDGFDLRQLDARTVRRRIAYVPDQPGFFQGSIAENLRLVHPFASEAEIRHALRLAAADEEVDGLEQGLQTIIGSLGARALPPRLRTRLSLARGYLDPASILLIGDLSSAVLSGPAGDNLKDYLTQAKGKRTVIFCSHRVDYLRLADKIVYLRGTDPTMVGNRETVLASLRGRDLAA